MKTVRLRIDRMHCNGCTEIVRHLLTQEEGVLGCTVSLEEQMARVAIDPDRTGAERLAEALGRAGYPSAVAT